SQIFFGYRTRLDFDTSFRGKDTLKVRLKSKNIERLDDVTDTLTSRLSVDGSSENQIEIAELSYTFSPTNNTEILFGTKGVSSEQN
ncbi:MAG: porin, partial [Cyanobacteria bacterium J083]